MRISDGSSDVFSSDLQCGREYRACGAGDLLPSPRRAWHVGEYSGEVGRRPFSGAQPDMGLWQWRGTAQPEGEGLYQLGRLDAAQFRSACRIRSEEHTSELQSLMRISSDVFCLKK